MSFLLSFSFPGFFFSRSFFISAIFSCELEHSQPSSSTFFDFWRFHAGVTGKFVTQTSFGHKAKIITVPLKKKGSTKR